MLVDDMDDVVDDVESRCCLEQEARWWAATRCCASSDLVAWPASRFLTRGGGSLDL